MNIGDLVKHRPTLLPIENILRKVSSIDELEIDFCLGVIVERTINKARIFSHELNDVLWYNIEELILVE